MRGFEIFFYFSVALFLIWAMIRSIIGLRDEIHRYPSRYLRTIVEVKGPLSKFFNIITILVALFLLIEVLDELFKLIF